MEYSDGEVIIHQGELGDCMYVVQEGQVEVLVEMDDNSVRVAILNPGDFFGEMAIFEREVRTATVRALGRAYVLAIDKRNLLRQIQADPSLAFNLVRSLSARIRELCVEITKSGQKKRTNN